VTEDWADRTLCPDGACTGVIGGDGVCKVCGRAAPFWGDERRRGMVDAEAAATGDAGPPDVDDDRQLCPDGACTGVLGADGACKVCGRRGVARVVRVVPPVAVVAAVVAAADDDERRLCPDGACTGLLDAGGTCKVCGRTDVGN
jgi:hypothetical protein